jgi:hypothetical protein
VLMAEAMSKAAIIDHILVIVPSLSKSCLRAILELYKC